LCCDKFVLLRLELGSFNLPLAFVNGAPTVAEFVRIQTSTDRS
jgi:hypothetical protein